ncbi:hypothetical protein [Streptomyces fructofermentans]|uniref:hypothetical protein n=1 Tax=Streptomyces fructofermentans TaxID=152141 RepID=UPI0033E200DB
MGAMEALNAFTHPTHLIQKTPEALSGGVELILPVTRSWFNRRVYKVHLTARSSGWSETANPARPYVPPPTQPLDPKGYEQIATTKPEIPSRDNFVVATNAPLIDLSTSSIRPLSSYLSPFVNFGVKLFGSANIRRNMGRPLGEHSTTIKLTDGPQTRHSEITWNHVVYEGNREIGRSASGGIPSQAIAEFHPITNDRSVAIPQNASPAQHPLQINGLTDLRNQTLEALNIYPGVLGTAHSVITKFLSAENIIGNYSQLRESGLKSGEFMHPAGGVARLELTIRERNTTYAGSVAYTKKVENGTGADFVTGEIGIKQPGIVSLGGGASAHVSGTPTKAYDPNDPSTPERPSTGPVAASATATLSYAPTILQEQWNVGGFLQKSSSTHSGTGHLYGTELDFDVRVWHNGSWQHRLTRQGSMTGLQPAASQPAHSPDGAPRSGSQDSITPPGTPVRPASAPMAEELETNPSIVFTHVPGSAELRHAITRHLNQEFPEILPRRETGAEISERAVATQALIESVTSSAGLIANARHLFSNSGLLVDLNDQWSLLIKTESSEGTHNGTVQLTTDNTTTVKLDVEKKRLEERQGKLAFSSDIGIGRPENDFSGAPAAEASIAFAPVGVSSTLDAMKVDKKRVTSGPADQFTFDITHNFAIIPKDTIARLDQGRPHSGENVGTAERSRNQRVRLINENDNRLHIEVLRPQLRSATNTSATDLPSQYILESVSDLVALQDAIMRSATTGLTRTGLQARQWERHLLAHLPGGQPDNVAASLHLLTSKPQLISNIDRSINSWQTEHTSSVVPESRKQPGISYSMHTRISDLTAVDSVYPDSTLETAHTSKSGIITYDQYSTWLGSGAGGEVGASARPTGFVFPRLNLKGKYTLQLDDADIKKHTAQRTLTDTFTGALRVHEGNLEVTTIARIMDEHGNEYFGDPQITTHRGRFLIPEPDLNRPASPTSSDEGDAAPSTMSGRQAAEFFRTMIGSDVFPRLDSNTAIIQEIHNALGGAAEAVPTRGLQWADVYSTEILNLRFRDLFDPSGITRRSYHSGAFKRNVVEMNLRAELASLQEVGTESQRNLTASVSADQSAANKNQYKTSAAIDKNTKMGVKTGLAGADAFMASMTHTDAWAREVGNEAGLNQQRERKTEASEPTVRFRGTATLYLTHSTKDGATYNRSENPVRTIPDVPFDLIAPRSLVRNLNTNVPPELPVVPAAPRIAGHLELDVRSPATPAWRTSLDAAHEIVDFTPSGNEQINSLHQAAAALYDRPSTIGRYLNGHLPAWTSDTIRSFYTDLSLPHDNPLRMEQQIPERSRHLVRALTKPMLNLYLAAMREGGQRIPETNLTITMAPIGPAVNIGRHDTISEKVTSKLDRIQDPHILDGRKWEISGNASFGINTQLPFRGNYSQNLAPRVVSERLKFNQANVNLPQGSTRETNPLTGLGNRAATHPDTFRTTTPVYFSRQPVEITLDNGQGREAVRGYLTYRTTQNDAATPTTPAFTPRQHEAEPAHRPITTPDENPGTLPQHHSPEGAATHSRSPQDQKSAVTLDFDQSNNLVDGQQPHLAGLAAAAAESAIRGHAVRVFITSPTKKFGPALHAATVTQGRFLASFNEALALRGSEKIAIDIEVDGQLSTPSVGDSISPSDLKGAEVVVSVTYNNGGSSPQPLGSGDSEAHLSVPQHSRPTHPDTYQETGPTSRTGPADPNSGRAGKQRAPEHRDQAHAPRPEDDPEWLGTLNQAAALLRAETPWRQADSRWLTDVNYVADILETEGIDSARIAAGRLSASVDPE